MVLDIGQGTALPHRVGLSWAVGAGSLIPGEVAHVRTRFADLRNCVLIDGQDVDRPVRGAIGLIELWKSHEPKKEQVDMTQIDVLQIQADLAHYIERVARGETIVVTRDSEPIVELRPIAPPVKKPRPIGLAKGTFEIPASFYEPLPPEVIDSFYGEFGSASWFVRDRPV